MERPDAWGDAESLAGCPRCLNDFREVVGDEGVEMLEVGYALALSRRPGVGHICWLCAKAEALYDFLNRGAAAGIVSEVGCRRTIQENYEANRRLPADAAPTGLGWVTPAECALRGRTIVTTGDSRQ